MGTLTNCGFVIMYLAIVCRGHRIEANDTINPANFLRTINSRIIEGVPVHKGEAPYQVSIQYRGQHICGGVILSENQVLTAASCLLSTHKRLLDAKYITIMAGSVDIDIPTIPRVEGAGRHAQDKRQFVNVSYVYMHEGFNTFTKENNVALIKVTPDWKFTSSDVKLVAAATLQSTTVPDGLNCSVSGWGLTSQTNVNYENVLRTAQVFIADHDKCQKIYPVITDNMICAGYSRTLGNVFCQGDIGAGLICNGELVGIASHSGGCGQEYYVGVFMELRPYFHWMDNTRLREDSGAFFDDRYNSAMMTTGNVLLLTAISFILTIFKPY